MKFITIISCILCFSLFYPVAQTKEDKIKEINNSYNRVAQGVGYGEFFVNEVKANATRLSLHFPGYYQHAQKYFYRITAQHPEPLLLLVAVRTEKKKIEYYREYLYDEEGNLQFYYEKQNDTKPYKQVRIYFFNTHVIKVLHDKTEFKGWESDVFPKASEALVNADIYYDKFQAQLQEIQSVKW